MRINYDGPYRERRGIAQELRAYIVIAKIIVVTAILLLGFHTLNRLDAVMAQQAEISEMQVWLVESQEVQNDRLVRIRDNTDWLRENAEWKAGIADLSGFNLTEEERHLIERVVASEARGESVEGQMAVAQVIRDRSTEWGMSVTDVVMAQGQFASPYTGEISPEIVQAVRAVFDEGTSVFDEPVTHFHADYVSPDWAADKASRGSIGTHRFYGE